MLKARIRGQLWQLKKKWQRFKRGWSDADMWNIDTWFLETIEPMLKTLRMTHVSHPARYTPAEWETKLDEMLECLRNMDEDFVAMQVFDGDYLDPKMYEHIEQNKNRFFGLFSENFFDLWD